MGRKTTIFFFILFNLLIFIGISLSSASDENYIHLMKGTKIESSGNLIRFIMPDKMIEVIGTGGLLRIKAYDKTHQLLHSAKQGQLIYVLNTSELRNQQVLPEDLILLNFKGLGPQPDPPGKIFLLKSGTKISRDKGDLVFATDNGTKLIFMPEPNGVTGKCQAYDSANKLLFTRANAGLARMIDFQSLKNKGAIQNIQTWIIFSSEIEEK
ncbi:MAG: hypothetical protein C0168_03545 [Candidatus Aminicenantes bacterium]|nr:MAG: hypothetical protein C0168_03545 [Candidatus Aminicenantes bacterium]